MNKKIIIGIIAALLIAYLGMQWMASSAIEEQIETAIAEMPGFEITYDDLDVSLFRSSISIAGLKAVGEKGILLKFDNFEASTDVNMSALIESKGESGFPEYMSASIEGVSFTQNGMPMLNMMSGLSKIGYNDQIKVDFAFNFNYDEGDQELSINSLSFGVDELGEINATMNLGNVDLSKEGLETMDQKKDDYTLLDLTVNYTDNSLVNLFMESMAVEGGFTTEEFKVELVKQLKADPNMAVNNIVEEIRDEFIQFITDPEGLEISMSSPEGINMEAAQGRPFSEVVSILNLEVEAL